ncbi:MAG: fibronectin type III domain-containing protein, partial [Bacteroidota bacterium]
MKKTTGFFLALILVCTLAQGAWAQQGQFGVSATLTLPTTNSPFLEDYVSPSSGTMLLLRLNDRDLPSLDVQLRFRLRLVGQDVPLLESQAAYQGEIFTLLPGAPTLVTASDLEDVLATQNLSLPGFFGAYSAQDFLRTGQLPEGRYQLEFYTVEVNRTDQRVSNYASAFITTTLTDPPQWTAPKHEEVVSATDPQNVVFQWSPNNGLGAAPVSQTQYTFRIWELADPTLDHNWITQSLLPLEEVVTRQPLLVFNQTNTPLIPGQRYAIQVQATVTDDRALFRNEGKSEVQVFQFGRACTAASNFVVSANTPYRASLSWQPGEANNNFTVRFREAGSLGEWHTRENYQATVELEQLREGTEYEYQVFPTCGSLQAPASKVQTFSTASQPKSTIDLECGNAWVPDSITNREPLAAASFGDQWTIGGFDLFVNQVDGQNGSFTGEGEIYVPWLFSTVAVVFQNLKVNEQGEPANGPLV